MSAKYSLPYTDNLFDYLSSNEDLIPKVVDIFFSDDSLFPSSRISMLNSKNWEEIARIKQLGINLNYVLNPTVWDYESYSLSGKMEFTKNILKLRKKGVDTITFNNTMLLRDKLIRKTLEGMTLKNSVNNLVTSLDQVVFFVEELGINNIFLGRDINRNLDELKNIASYTKPRGVVLHALANEFCLSRCPYKLFCDSLLSQGYKNLADFRINGIRKTLSCGENWELKKYLKCAVIYPKQIPILSEYIDVFKITGRGTSISSLKLTLDAYLRGKDILLANLISQKYSGEIMLRDIPSDYYERTLNCKNLCHVCKYCELTGDLLVKTVN